MAVEQQAEIERKYDVSRACVVPDLSRLPGVARAAPPEELEQVATYYDTSDLRLLSQRITLRRRVGGLDDGWHLKLPGGDDDQKKSQNLRQELRMPLGGGSDGRAPDELLSRVRVHLRDDELRAAAVLTTRRRVHRLLDPDGAVLAELCDDEVRAETDAPSGEEWREWELEVVDGDPSLIEAAEPLLLEAGATRSGAQSKLLRVLADRLPPPPAWQGAGDLSGSPVAGEVLLAYLGENLRKLHRQDQLFRAGDQDGVHQLRVAARRMRSALATYSSVLRKEQGAALRSELRWLGLVLSDARDAQVQRQRLSALVTDQPAELVLGPVQRRLDDELSTRFRAGRQEAAAVLDGERYFRLLDALEDLVTEPPTTDEAHRSARTVVPDLLRSDLKRVLRRHDRWEQAAGREVREHALHDVRKAAKRLRYAAESAQPVLGTRASRLAEAAEAVQELLGEHQDTVVARTLLRELGVRAHLDGENGFTFGRLHALEEARADEIVRQYPEALGALPTRRLRSWLRG